jgi:hypothetical protein
VPDRPQYRGYPQSVRLVCPGCEEETAASVDFFEGDPWPIFAHQCQCGYLITESEWNEAAHA